MFPTFKDINHEQFYEGNIRMTHSQQDPYRKALFYLFGLMSQTRQHIQDVYDFEESGIRPEGLEKSWQTSSTIKLTRLAFNLYNGYAGDENRDNVRNYSPYYLFDNGLLPYFAEAVKLRYAEYAHPMEQSYLPFSMTNETSLYEEHDMET